MGEAELMKERVKRGKGEWEKKIYNYVVCRAN
jgi:hypothetical protein